MSGTDWRAHFERAQGRLLSDLEALVTRESPSDDAGRVSALAAWIVERLRRAGVRAESRPCPPRGDAVLASIGSGDGTLLLGHHDTVWPAGSLAEMPFRRVDVRATGPGVFDMKAGIAVALGVMEAFAARADPRPVSLLLTPDEEIGTQASRALLLETARRHRQVLVLEPSLDGAAKIARKGTGRFDVRFSGRAAHAGLDPDKGASALLELARFTILTAGLADEERGTTVVATLAQGGSRANVVPERATVTLDARVWSQAEAARLEAALRAYRATDARVGVEVEGGFDRPPLEPTPAAAALYERARDVARSLGFELGAARVGGASDGNLTAAAGIPTLDGLGPRGDGAHARHEFVLVSDLPVRAALLAGLIETS